jgi:8-oxo-dGTP pyrophosphatase MutT (NUDIX family)
MSFTTTADLEARLAARLDPVGVAPARTWRGDEPAGQPAFDPASLTKAAVLTPIVRRPGGWTLLLTLRTATMPTHAGQISFPGGRIQSNDASPMAAAIRETYEETGLDPFHIQPIGGYDAYQTGTGYMITPVVAYVEPGFALAPDPREVEEVFETPLDFLMNPANHQRHQREFADGRVRNFYAMAHEGRFIWGATAGLIRSLYERLYGAEQET